MFVPHLILLVLLVILLSLVGLLIYILWGLFITAQGAFFAPTSDERLEDVLKLAKIRKGDRVVDLGSGDGRVLIALAEQGAKGDGYEIDPWLVAKSREAIKKEGLDKKLKIYFKSLWDSDLSQYDVIVIYGINRIMARLQDKIWNECKDGTRVVSVCFEFPNWQEEKKAGEVRLYIV